MVVKIVDLVEVWRGGGNRWNVRVTLLIWMLTKTPSDSHVRINNDKHLHNDVANYDIILIPRAHTSTAFANPIANPDCKKGPEFWCHSLSNAKACDQVQYCHATVWKVSYKPRP